MAKGFQKGVPRPKNAGRKKGTPNKATMTIFQSLEQIVTEDGQPIDIIKLFFDGLMDMPSFQRVDALLKFMEFIYPKRKQVEVNLGDDEFKKALVQRIQLLNGEANRTRVIEPE